MTDEDTEERKIKLPKDNPDYDGQELFIKQTFTGTSADVEGDYVKITWKYIAPPTPPSAE